MRLANLADRLRAFGGFTLYEDAGWRTRGANGRDLSAVRGVMWHHTATPASRPGNMPSLGLLRSGRSDLPGPLSQLGLGRDGTVYLIAAGRANHAGAGVWSGLSGNSDTIGIEMESPGDGSWTPAQRAVMPRLARALSVIYGIEPSRHVAHREWAPRRKIDPAGVDMTALRRAAAATPTPPTPAPSPTEEDMPLSDDDLGKIRREVWGKLINGVTAEVLLLAAQRNAAQAAGRDADEIVAGVLEGLSPDAIAAAIPVDLADRVIDALGSRIAGGAE